MITGGPETVPDSTQSLEAPSAQGKGKRKPMPPRWKEGDLVFHFRVIEVLPSKIKSSWDYAGVCRVCWHEHVYSQGQLRGVNVKRSLNCSRCRHYFTQQDLIDRTIDVFGEEVYYEVRGDAREKVTNGHDLGTKREEESTSRHEELAKFSQELLELAMSRKW